MKVSKVGFFGNPPETLNTGEVVMGPQEGFA